MLPARTPLIRPPRIPRRRIFAVEIGDGGRGDLGRARLAQVQGSMRAMLVVVRDVLIQDGEQVPFRANRRSQHLRRVLKRYRAVAGLISEYRRAA